MEPVVIETRGLTKRYGHHAAVRDLTLEVREGEIFGFLGPNGAGKTTTILMLLGLTPPTAGAAGVCGLDPAHDPVAVKRVVGYLPENVGFYDDLTGVQNLKYVARLNGLGDGAAMPRITTLLDQVGLTAAAGQRVGTYSRGMRQRLGIAEVLLKEPRVVILDEPTLGLDPDGTVRMLDMIRALSRERGLTVFFSSHLLDQVQRVSDRIGIMLQGRLAAAGSLGELAARSFGVDHEEVTLEQIYMRYFRESRPEPVAA
jgi:ABC-2 type transport system ATP-binding protein